MLTLLGFIALVVLFRCARGLRRGFFNRRLLGCSGFLGYGRLAFNGSSVPMRFVGMLFVLYFGFYFRFRFGLLCYLFRLLFGKSVVVSYFYFRFFKQTAAAYYFDFGFV